MALHWEIFNYSESQEYQKNKENKISNLKKAYDNFQNKISDIFNMKEINIQEPKIENIYYISSKFKSEWEKSIKNECDLYYSNYPLQSGKTPTYFRGKIKYESKDFQCVVDQETYNLFISLYGSWFQKIYDFKIESDQIKIYKDMIVIFIEKNYQINFIFFNSLIDKESRKICQISINFKPENYKNNTWKKQYLKN